MHIYIRVHAYFVTDVDPNWYNLARRIDRLLQILPNTIKYGILKKKR